MTTGKRTMRIQPIAAILCVVVACAAAAGDEIDKKYPLSEELRVLADDADSAAYRQLVMQMLITDLEAEWQRVETRDNAESFAAAHGGSEKIAADPDLKAAYERRVKIRDTFLDVMRDGFASYERVPPFDTGEKAERAGTSKKAAAATNLRLEVILPAPGAEREWPRFRGPDGQGHALARDLPTHWSATENVVWRTELPGFGNSSPCIWGNRIFLTSAGDEGVDQTLHCLARDNGRLLWSRVMPPHKAEENVRDKNGHASATPVTDGERVIVFFGSGGIASYDFDGRREWHYPMDGMFETTWGSGASPLLYENSLILIHDQNVAASIFIALDKRTGKLLWQHERPKYMGWSTPLALRVNGRDELIYAGGETVKGYDPRTGNELWTLRGPTHEVVPTPIIGQHLVYSASGRQGPTIALRPGGRGDVTDSHFVWRTVRGGPHVPSPIYYRGRIYTVNDTGIATCLDGETGEIVWQSRVRDKFSASPIEAEGLLYFPSETGVTYVLRPGDKLDVVAENDLGSPILASPAALGNRLFLRTADALVAIGKE